MVQFSFGLIHFTGGPLKGMLLVGPPGQEGHTWQREPHRQQVWLNPLAGVQRPGCKGPERHWHSLTPALPSSEEGPSPCVCSDASQAFVRTLIFTLSQTKGHHRVLSRHVTWSDLDFPRLLDGELDALPLAAVTNDHTLGGLNNIH